MKKPKPAPAPRPRIAPPRGGKKPAVAAPPEGVAPVPPQPAAPPTGSALPSPKR